MGVRSDSGGCVDLLVLIKCREALDEGKVGGYTLKLLQ